MDTLALNTFPITKTDQANWAAEIARPLLDGEIDPLDFMVKANGLKTALDGALKMSEVKELVSEEIAKYGKTAEMHGAKLTVKETGVKYDFSQCGDPIYNGLVAQLEEVQRKVKERQDFLKHIPTSGITELNEETGEVVFITPPSRSASESIVITFAKK